MVAARLLTFGAVAVFASVAATSPSVQEIKNLLARQDHNDADDSAERQCHADCGFTIIQSQESNARAHCGNQTWVDQLNRCLACTNREDDDDIWEDYGNSVSNAAEACGGQTAIPGAVLSTASATGTASGASLTQVSGAANATGTAATTAPTSLADCHTHGDDLFCFAGGAEWEVTSDINVANAPDSFND